MKRLQDKSVIITIANCIIGCSLLVVIGMLCYGIFRYERILYWQFGWNLTRFDGVLCFYIFPIITLIFLGYSVRWEPSRKINIALVLVSLFLSLYTVEGGLAVWKMLHISRSTIPTDILQHQKLQQKRKIAAAKEGKSFDTRSRLQMLQDLRQLTDDVHIVIHPFDYNDGNPALIGGKSVYPLGGVSDATTLFCNENGEWLSYRSDEYGFHNPNELYHPGNVSIAVVGDSFVQGYCVPSEKNFVALLREVYPQTLNFGVGAYGPLLEFAVFKEYVEPLHPHIVLWTFFLLNDFDDLRQEQKHPFLLKYLEGDTRHDLFRLQPDIDQYIAGVIEQKLEESLDKDSNQCTQPMDLMQLFFDGISLRHLRLRLKLTFIPPSHVKAAAQQNDAPVVLLHEILTKVKASVSAWGGKLYFVYLPGWYSIIDSTLDKKNGRDEILSLANRLEIPIIDFYPIFLAHEDPYSLFPFQMRGHYNERGHRLVAETILQKLQHEQ